ncbi:MAG: glycan-binding surface protein [Paludibacteraceae bacterium]|nr:glycan-binding surface protein [Paludibacteraceae bacterium]
MKKKILPILALGTFGLASYAGTYMVVTKSDGTVVEYNVNDVDSVSYRTCRCECDLPVVDSWSFMDGSKGGGSLIPSGSAVVFKGTGLSEITSVTFDDEEAEISFPLSTDDQLVLKVPTVTKETGYARFHTKMCKDGFEVGFYVDDISNIPPCVTMCDNEFAVKTMKVVGNSLFAPLTAKFWDGKDYTIEASTEDGSIVIDDPNHATIYIPKGVADGGHIVFSNFAGETITDFIYRDTRNMLITNDDKDYLDKFNDGKPDEDFGKKDYWVEKVNSTAMNTNGNFSVFWDANFTSYTYQPDGEANDIDAKPVAATPFGIFEESIINGETTFNDYVIKFEVYVDESKPMIGNGLCIGFYDVDLWDDIRQYCAFWQPSEVIWNKPLDSDWTIKDLKPWHTNGDWMTVTIPMEELRYDFMTKNYVCEARNDRVIDYDVWEENPYAAFGDKKNGLPFFEKNSNLVSKLKAGMANEIRNIGIIYDSYDEPNIEYEPYIAVDNLRIVPKDNNGGVYPLLKWGIPSRDFYLAPVYNCK